jgi:hypothetical protein
VQGILRPQRGDVRAKGGVKRLLAAEELRRAFWWLVDELERTIGVAGLREALPVAGGLGREGSGLVDAVMPDRSLFWSWMRIGVAIKQNVTNRVVRQIVVRRVHV